MRQKVELSVSAAPDACVCVHGPDALCTANLCPDGNGTILVHLSKGGKR